MTFNPIESTLGTKSPFNSIQRRRLIEVRGLSRRRKRLEVGKHVLARAGGKQLALGAEIRCQTLAEDEGALLHLPKKNCQIG